MTYRIAVAYSALQLAELVNDYTSEGWTPLGGVNFVRDDSGREKWAQAMVKQ